MAYSNKLSLAQLIREMRKATSSYGRTTQRDTLSDIADLVESQELAQKEGCWVESRYWGIRYTGTVMCRTNDFGVWESEIKERYRIMWSLNSGWSFEEL